MDKKKNLNGKEQIIYFFLIGAIFILLFFYFKSNSANRDVFMSLFELLYYFTGLVIAFTAVYALKQIKNGFEQTNISWEMLEIARKDSEVRFIREAATETAKQCDRFASEIIPLIEEILEIFRSNHIDLFQPDNTDFQPNKKVILWLNKWFDKSLEAELGPKITSALNMLESFSIYYTQGICSESIAYQPIADPFIFAVKAYYPFIIINRYNNKNAYNNIVQLYTTWIKRQLEEEIQDKNIQKEKDIQEMMEQLASINEHSMSPIGVQKNKHSNKKGK